MLLKPYGKNIKEGKEKDILRDQNKKLLLCYAFKKGGNTESVT
jgi:hypothetical protein